MSRVCSPAPLAVLLLGVALGGCGREALGTQPIPLADRPPWQTLLTEPGFRIAMDTSRMRPGPEHVWLLRFVTAHATPQGSDSLRFDRGRIRLLVRCHPLSFKSVSQELALGDSRPVFRQAWPPRGPHALPWRVPAADATDGRFLSAACAILEARRPGA